MVKSQLFAGFLSLLALPALASETFVIADLSGSMYQKMDGVSRLDMLKGPVNSFVQESNKGTLVNLIRFGVESKGCSSLEYFQGLDRKGFDARIKESTPRPFAQTPLTPALELLKSKISTELPTRVFIISDGENSCGASPCDTILELRKKNPKIEFDVLLLGENKKAQAELSCISSRVRPVKSPLELTETLTKMASERQTGTDSKTTPVDLGSLRIRNLPDFHAFRAQMIRPHSKQAPLLTTIEESQGENVLPLSPGTYLVTLPKYGSITKAIIRPGQLTELDFYTSFNLPAARLRLTHRTYKGSIKYTASSGRGREQTLGEWAMLRPGKNSLRLTHPESLAGMIVADLVFEPEESVEIDLTDRIGIYENPNPFPVILRNERFFDTHSQMKAAQAFFLMPSMGLPLPPGAYLVEKSGDVIAPLKIGGETL